MPTNIKWRVLAGAALWLAVLSPARADDELNTDAAQKAVVHVWAFEDAPDPRRATLRSGSGFVVSPGGYIVTNYHVISGATEVAILVQGEDEPQSNSVEELGTLFRRHPAKVLYVSKGRDLAVLKVDALPIAPLTLADAPLGKNMSVYAIGYPGAADDLFQAPTADPTVTNGVVGRLYSAPLKDGGTGESIPVIQHNAPINHGNSGGPLLDGCGRVIGVNTWGNSDQLVNDGDGTYIKTSSGVYYASNAINLISFLRANDIPITATSDACATSVLMQFMQRGAVDGGVAVLLLALLFAGAFIFRRPRKAIIASVNRTAEAVSRRVGGARASKEDVEPEQVVLAKRPPPPPAPFQKIRFAGRREASRYSFEIGRSLLQRSRNGAVIGRLHSGVDIMVEDDEISRRHARVRLDGNRVVIEDLGSLNGTEADGVKLMPDLPSPLRPGSVVRLGPLAFDVTFA